MSRASAGSIVAAGTLIPEGTDIPPRSLVMSSPGKVKRTLGDESLAEIQMYADRYVHYRLEYMNGQTGPAALEGRVSAKRDQAFRESEGG